MARHAASPRHLPVRRGASRDPDHGSHRCHRGEMGEAPESLVPGATAVVEFMRAVNASSDPARVAQTVVARIAFWLPAACRAVLEPAPGGQARIVARSGLGLPEEASVRTIGAWVLRHSRIWRSARPRQGCPCVPGAGGRRVGVAIDISDAYRGGARTGSTSGLRPASSGCPVRGGVRCVRSSSPPRSPSTTPGAFSRRRAWRAPTI